MDDTDANSKGNNEVNVRSRLKTSTAKTRPAKGDLKTAEMAPADAQPISSVLIFLLTWNKELIDELNAEPELIAGPSSPTDPPKPTVMGASIRGKYP